MPEQDNTVLVQQQDAVAVITLNRPKRRNGVTVGMCEELYAAVQAVSAGDARVVVLRGAGDDFCVGADLAPQEAEARAATAEALGSIHHAATFLHAMPQVTIAAVDGGCAGAGLGWAAACDFRFASTRAKFATAFLNVGVSGDMGLAWALTRIVGGARARELLLFPDKFDAHEALAFGLVTRLFAPEVLHERTLALARNLCERDGFALRMMKANLLSAEELALAAYIEVETARHLHTTGGPDSGRRMVQAHRQSQARSQSRSNASLHPDEHTAFTEPAKRR